MPVRVCDAADLREETDDNDEESGILHERQVHLRDENNIPCATRYSQPRLEERAWICNRGTVNRRRPSILRERQCESLVWFLQSQKQSACSGLRIHSSGLQINACTQRRLSHPKCTLEEQRISVFVTSGSSILIWSSLIRMRIGLRNSNNWSPSGCMCWSLRQIPWTRLRRHSCSLGTRPEQRIWHVNIANRPLLRARPIAEH
jgi:hypothetical protein